MNTVPTLCATGCTIGVAAIGYTLGRTRPAKPESDFTHSLRGGLERGRSNRISSISLSLYGGSAHSSRPSTPLSRLRHRHSRNITTSDAGSERSKNTMSAAEEVEITQINETNTTAVTPLRRTKSKLKKVANVASPSSSPALSEEKTNHIGRPRPEIQASTPSPRISSSTPKKLVKRSRSRQLSSTPPAHRGIYSDAKVPTPPSERKLPFVVSEPESMTSPTRDQSDLAAEESLSRSEPSYLQFFTVTIPRKSSKSVSDSGAAKRSNSSIRRISPKSHHHATLVLPSSVHTQAEVILDETLELEDEIPASQTLLRSSNAKADHFSSPPNAPSSQDSPVDIRFLRRSFSFSTFLSPPPSRSRPYAAKSQRRKLSRRENASISHGETFDAKLLADKLSPSESKRNSGPDNDEEDPPPLPDWPTSRLGQTSTANSATTTANGTIPRVSSRNSNSPDLSILSSGTRNEMSKRLRHSATPSEINSSLFGSDRDMRIFSSGDEDDLDARSDTVYDSHRTGFTKSSNTHRGPPLETLFDEVPEIPETLVIFPSAKTRDSKPLQEGVNSSSENRNLSAKSTPGSANAGHLTQPETYSPSDAPRWSEEEDWDAEFAGSDPSSSPLQYKSVHARTESSNNSPRPVKHIAEVDPKNNLFDWSEQAPIERGSTNQAPPRPKTVHGKKDVEPRSSRSINRRAPSAMHARSHSVPALPDVEGKRTNLTQKFGTWGVGSKGVTEDWNDDFDFDDVQTMKPSPGHSRPSDGGNAVVNGTIAVPSSIRERQNKVIANIGLLREWGMYIEELKELRARAVHLGARHGEHAKIFDEADAMIELADQEAENEPVGPGSPLGSSIGFSNDDVDTNFDLSPSQTHPHASEASELDDSEAVQTETSSPTVSSAFNTPRLTGRPRKNSELLARSVIEALHKRRDRIASELSPASPARQGKVPFDTATLKHIVPYVGALNHRVKQALRKVEGLGDPNRESMDEG